MIAGQRGADNPPLVSKNYGLVRWGSGRFDARPGRAMPSRPFRTSMRNVGIASFRIE
jgi:hypothetical protein